MDKRLKSLVIALLFVAVFAAYLIPFDSWKWQVVNWRNELRSQTITRDPVEFLLRRLVRGEDRTKLKQTGFSCHSDYHSKVCLTHKPVRINNTALEVYISSNQTTENSSDVKWVHPYAMQENNVTLEQVTPLKIIQQNSSLPHCDFVHDVPVVVFSTGGFTGNLFHEFDETIIPLFITCHHFQGYLQFIITDHKPWWVRKYNRILSKLSHYDVINPDKDGSVHCFNGAVIGLKFHNILTLNYTDIPGGYSMGDFQTFLRKTYDLQVRNVSETKEKPVLMLISRRGSRKFTNEEEMVDMIKELGFEVIITTPNRMSNLDKFTSVVNSCSVMVGAHGAGLTNELFLPAGAVVVQVVPLGLDWPSTFLFGHPAADMGLHYLEYKIEPKESSLWDTYGPEHPVIRDPESIFAKGYLASRAIYIDGQNLKINISRFKETLIEAKKLIGQKVSAD